MTARGPAAQGRCISLLPAVSAVSALFIAAAVSSHRRKGPVFSPHLGRTRGVRPPFCGCPQATGFAQQNRRTLLQKKRRPRASFFCGCSQVLLSALPPTARKGECEGETFDGFPHSRSITRPQAVTFAQQKCCSKKERHPCGCLSFLEQGTGVEPALTAWEAAVIPIYQPCNLLTGLL